MARRAHGMRRNAVTASDEGLQARPAQRGAVRGRARRQVGLNARHNGAAFVFLAPWIVGMLFLIYGFIRESE